MFNLDIPSIVKRHTLYDLRKPINLAYRRCLLAPLLTIEGWLDALRADIELEYKYNGLLHSMTRMLNDKYDPVLKRIQIIPLSKQPIWFWKNESEQPDWYWKHETDNPDWYWMDTPTFNATNAYNYEFTIKIHVEIPFVPAEVLELVDIYRFAGYRPRIVIYGNGLPEEEVDNDYYID